MCIRKYQFLPHFHSSSDPDSFFSFSYFLLPSFRIFLLWALLLRARDDTGDDNEGDYDDANGNNEGDGGYEK